MSNTQTAQLTQARANGAFGFGVSSPATRLGADGADKAIKGASVNRMWYGHPERLMSQSEPIPS
jgi:hypothetical protein